MKRSGSVYYYEVW